MINWRDKRFVNINIQVSRRRLIAASGSGLRTYNMVKKNYINNKFNNKI